MPGRALILGDSQAGATRAGGALATCLQANGYTVNRISESGRSTSGTLQTARTLDLSGYDLAVIFTGGNNATPQADAARELVALFPPTTAVHVFGPPPATVIGSLQAARAAFSPTITDPSNWFPKTAERREVTNAALRQAIGQTRATYHDWRDLGLGGVVQPSGVRFPILPDGIHVPGDVFATALGPDCLPVRPFPWLIATLSAAAAAYLIRRNRRAA